MSVELESCTLPVVRRRPDGTTVTPDDVAQACSRLNVAAAVLDGSEVGLPGLLLVRTAVDQDANITLFDGKARPGMTLEQFLAVLATQLDTALPFPDEDVVVQADGTFHEITDSNREELAVALGACASEDSWVVHVFRSTDLIQPRVGARELGAPVTVVLADGWTVAREPDDTDTAWPHAPMKDELPAFRIEHNAAQRVIEGSVSVGRKTSSFVCGWFPVPTLVRDDYPEHVVSALLPPSAPEYEDDLRLDPETEAAITTAMQSPERCVEKILGLFEVPDVAARWVEGEAPPVDARVIEPASMASLLLAEAEPTGPFARLTRLSRRHPWLAVTFGVIELTIAVALFTVAGDWDVPGWVRIIAGVLFAVDGLGNTVGGAIRLRRRRGNSP